METGHRIDVHHHILPPDYMEALAGIETPDWGTPLPAWNVETALGMMERQGIASAITSIPFPPGWGDRDFARTWARHCNEFTAGLVHDDPEHFGAFGVVPLPYLDEALEEIEYALGTLGFDGVVLNASCRGRYLGAADQKELFDELERREAIVFVHPMVPPDYAATGLDLPAAMLEFTFDTTRAAVNLLYSGTLGRCQRTRFILSHAGGTVPYLAGRIGLFRGVPALAERAGGDPLELLRALYYDTALSANPSALLCLQELVAPSQILFGSDYPMAPEPVAAATVRGLEKYAGFDERARRSVECENARALFPRFS